MPDNPFDFSHERRLIQNINEIRMHIYARLRCEAHADRQVYAIVGGAKLCKECWDGDARHVGKNGAEP